MAQKRTHGPKAGHGLRWISKWHGVDHKVWLHPPVPVPQPNLWLSENRLAKESSKRWRAHMFVGHVQLNDDAKALTNARAEEVARLISSWAL